MIANTLIIVLAIVVAFILLGAMLDILRCVVIAAIVAIGGMYLYRRLSQRSNPASKQIIDQSSAPPEQQNEATDVARQIEARKERLGQ